VAVRTWTLEINGRRLGELVVISTDWPWVHAAFTATSNFDPWRTRFDNALAKLDPTSQSFTESGEEAGALNVLVTVISPEGETVSTEAFYVRGDRAWWRVG
jgi:hypothetical protein